MEKKYYMRTWTEVPDHTPISIAVTKGTYAIAAVSASHTYVFQEVIKGTSIVQFIGCHRQTLARQTAAV